MTDTTHIELVEHTPRRFPREQFSEHDMEKLWQEHGKRVIIDPPGFETDWQWQLTSQGWVGYIPINEQLGLALMPKVPLANLFRMLEYAYRLNSFGFDTGLFSSESLQDFYERLAELLAKKVLIRTKRGLYHSYNNHEEPLSYVRGRIDFRDKIKRPWEPRLQCQFQEHDADVKENQILLWTLHKIIRSGLCTERALPVVRKAYRGLQGQATLENCFARECIKRLYNRLNHDYQPMHALCRFFLDQSGPSHTIGEYNMVPFVVDMNRLFELFVAEWLKVHLPSGYELRAQDNFSVGENGEVSCSIDLVVYDIRSDCVRCVLDTKYKTHNTPAPADVYQVSFYALAKKCSEAILLYPTEAIEKFSGTVGDIRVRSMSFGLGGDLETNGAAFLAELLESDDSGRQ